MEWNQHRLAYLSGIEGLNTSRSKLLKESRTGRSRKSNHPNPGSLEALNEARLRSALRKEILSVLREELAAKDDKQVRNGLNKMSLSTSMGFGGYGFSPRTTSNRAAARTGTTVAFGGPGFM